MRATTALEQQLRWLRWLQNSSAGLLDWRRQRVDFAEQALKTAETYYWAKPVMDIINEVVHDMPNNWQFRMDRLPSERGFFWFEDPLLIANDDAATHHVQSVVWSSGISEQSGQAAINMTAFVEPLDSALPAHLVSTIFQEGDQIEDVISDIGRQPTAQVSKVAGVCAVCTLACCLSFLAQKILVSPGQSAERHVRRRLERQGFDHEPVVRVVELRRKQAKSDHAGEHEAVDWSHQWIVSGHWRQQWHPSLNTHQPRWIMPYVKGPEDKPLKPPRAKVFAVVR